jgi:hypothetical protein
MEEIDVATRDYTGVTTEQIVVEMLTENTGSHFLDSGGAYGRHWQRNQGRDFSAEPVVSHEWSVWRNKEKGEVYGRPDLMATVSLYHWMVHSLEFDAELQVELDQYAEANSGNWLQVQEEFAEQLHEQGRLDCEPRTFNTYNDPDYIDLSQVIQYVSLTLDGEHEPTHMIVSVHGGCDVRGGYGAPKVFKMHGEEYDIWDTAHVKDFYLVDGSAGWWGNGPCTRDIEPADYNPEGLKLDFTQLPTYTVEWVVELCPAAAEVQAALDSIPDKVKALQENFGESGVTHAKSMERTQAALRKELLDLCRDWLIEQHGVALLVHDHKLWLAAEDPEELAEIRAGVSWA